MAKPPLNCNRRNLGHCCASFSDTTFQMSNRSTRNFFLFLQAKDNHRKTKLAYVDGVTKAPRNIIRTQEKNGTGGGSGFASTPSPSSSATSFQPKKYSGQSSGSMSQPGSSGSGSASVSVPAPPAAAAAKKPKVAPMMAKTLKMVRGLKVNFRR